MSKYCQQCKSENDDDAFWCSTCNTKILNNAVVYNENPCAPVPLENEQKRRGSDTYYPRLLLVPIIIGVLTACCLIPYLLVNEFHLVLGDQDFLGIDSQINQDFWFKGNYLNTSEGWSFELTKVAEYRLEGRILALKTYSKNDFPHDPCNIFSPIDLFIGIDNVQTNTEIYDYSITSFQHRKVTWYLYNDDVNDYYYFKSHTGNNHIIPHTKEVLDILAHNISTGDVVILQGSLVNLYGINKNQYWKWTTDTDIGNYDCEIILVDEIDVFHE